MMKKSIINSLACKGLSNDDIGVARGTVFHDIRPGAGLKTGDCVQETLGGLQWNDSEVTCTKAFMGVTPTKASTKTSMKASTKASTEFSTKACMEVTSTKAPMKTTSMEASINASTKAFTKG